MADPINNNPGAKAAAAAAGASSTPASKPAQAAPSTTTPPSQGVDSKGGTVPADKAVASTPKDIAASELGKLAKGFTNPETGERKGLSSRAVELLLDKTDV